MTRTLFLHAGPPKTGTTAIQMYFRDNAEAFRRQGLYRPKTGTEDISHLHRGLVFAFSPQSKLHHLSGRLAAELRQQGLPDRVFISAEFFALRLRDPRYVAALKQFCSDLGYRLHIIAYLRPQSPLLNSLYAQLVKNWQAPGDMEAFVSRQLAGAEHNYAQLFLPLLDDAAIDVTLRPFSRTLLAAGITRDISQVMSLASDMRGLTAPVNANISPGPKTIRAFQCLTGEAGRELPGLERKRLNALTRPLIMAAGALGWNRTKFGGIDGELHHLIDGRFRQANDSIAYRAWSRSWAEVFSPEECAPPAFDVFDPAAAGIEQRNEFHSFIANSMASIREFAAG